MKRIFSVNVGKDRELPYPESDWRGTVTQPREHDSSYKTTGVYSQGGSSVLQQSAVEKAD